ncbi:MAG: helix-turn-helix transcriptional regulator [Ruminococcus sp.]|nr:helix-turn-helix transcriptional regulator [Ruminococcus sp.]
MKITRIKTAESKSAEMKGKAIQDHCLYLFRSPVILTLGGMETVCSAGTAILYEGGISRFFRGAGGRELKYDLVQFRPSSADKHYIGGLDFPLNKPIEMADSYILATTIKNFSFHIHSGGKRRSELGEVYMRLIFIALEEGCLGNEAEISDIPRFNQLREIRSEIYDNPAVQLSVDILCKRLGVGKTYFHKIYKTAFGITFRQDVIKSRINCACQLLTETKLSVSVVAEKCGYENESFFMKQFRQQMNCTPSQYRNKIF